MMPIDCLGGSCSRRRQNAQPVALPGVCGPSRQGFPQPVWILTKVTIAPPRTGRLSRQPRGNLRWCGSLDLLSTPLTIPVMGCQINSFRRVSSCGETMARRRKEERRAGTASRGIVRRLGRFSSRVRPLGFPACGVVAVPRALLSVATCAVHYCATRGSIAPLFYPPLLAT